MTPTPWIYNYWENLGDTFPGKWEIIKLDAGKGNATHSMDQEPSTSIKTFLSSSLRGYHVKEKIKEPLTFVALLEETDVKFYKICISY